jgi:hypothetical protein
MRKRNARTIAMWCVGVGVVVLVGTGWAMRERIMETYWLWRLEHGDDREKKHAAERLGSLASAKAVRPLIEHMVRLAPRHHHYYGSRTGSHRLREVKEWEENWPGQVLARIGTPSVRPVFARLVGFERRLGSVTARGEDSERVFAGYAWCQATLIALDASAAVFLKEASCDTDHGVLSAAV